MSTYLSQDFESRTDRARIHRARMRGEHAALQHFRNLTEVKEGIAPKSHAGLALELSALTTLLAQYSTIDRLFQETL